MEFHVVLLSLLVPLSRFQLSDDNSIEQNWFRCRQMLGDANSFFFCRRTGIRWWSSFSRFLFQAQQKTPAIGYVHHFYRHSCSTDLCDLEERRWPSLTSWWVIIWRKISFWWNFLCDWEAELHKFILIPICCCGLSMYSMLLCIRFVWQRWTVSILIMSYGLFYCHNLVRRANATFGICIVANKTIWLIDSSWTVDITSHQRNREWPTDGRPGLSLWRKPKFLDIKLYAAAKERNAPHPSFLASLIPS